MRRPQWLPARQDLTGLGLAAGLGVAALLIARALPPSPFVSDILLAMVLGAAVLNTPIARLFRLAQPGTAREADRYASGLRFTGKWVLRAGIILMGLKVQTGFFGAVELALMVGVAAASVPSAFFVAHALAAALGIRRAMGDLVAGGTMICGASAINAIAPLAGARRDEQGIAIGVTFVFSVLALVAFRPIAAAVHLDPTLAGIWSGLAVNDLSSAVAVGSQMGGAGGVMAAAAKSLRVLLLAPVLVIFAVMRRDVLPVRVGAAGRGSMRQSVVEQLPAFVLGYVALAIVRAAGDRLFGGAPAWAAVLRVDKTAVDVCMVAVGASIGLHLALRNLLATSAPAMAVGAGASAWMASLTLAMIVATARGAHLLTVVIAVAALLASHALYRAVAGERSVALRVRRLFERGQALSMADAGRLLDAAERDGALEDGFLRRVLEQLQPSIGELIPVRHSPLPHGAGCRWMTYWEGQSGWALVALSRQPGSATPIHAHPHRLIGKSIEGTLEEVRFREHEHGELEVSARKVLAHGELVEADGLRTVHLVRAVGPTPAIDLQLRGPEDGSAGRCFRVAGAFDPTTLRVGQRLRTTVDADDRPGHGGEGAAAGRVAAIG